MAPHHNSSQDGIVVEIPMAIEKSTVTLRTWQVTFCRKKLWSSQGTGVNKISVHSTIESMSIEYRLVV